MLSILQRVDLAYLLERDGVLEEEVNWQEELSLGEQQRLAIARLLHHRPKFAILDECTSGCSAAIEKQLYDIVAELSITVITISHRPALLAFHSRLLTIGDGRQGWKLTDVDRSKHQQQIVNGSGTDGRMDGAKALEAAASHQEARSAPYAALHKRRTDTTIQAKHGTLGRFLSVVKIALPKGGHMYSRVALLLAVMAVQTRVSTRSVRILGEMMGCLVSSDIGRWRYWVLHSIGNGAIIVGLRQIMNYMTRCLHSDMKVNLSNRLMELYFRSKTFYRVSNIDRRIGNPGSPTLCFVWWKLF